MAEDTSPGATKHLLSSDHLPDSDPEFSDFFHGPRAADSNPSLAESLCYSPPPFSPPLPNSPPLHTSSKTSSQAGLGLSGLTNNEESPFLSLDSAAKQVELQRGGSGINRPKNAHRSVTFHHDSEPTLPDVSKFPDSETCATQQGIWRSRRHWSTIVLLLFSFFSTTFSGIYVGIALARPAWPSIRPDGSLTAQNASVLQIAFAKLIEMTYVTVFCAFVGQVVSRRAFMTQHGQGINLAEVNIRQWLTQPGSIISHPHTVRYAIWSLIGGLSMLATICALLYTTAAESLVSPQLVWDIWREQALVGEVRTSFANRYYVGDACSPLPTTDDWDDSHNTCLQIQHVAEGFSNFQQYKSTWPGVDNSSSARRHIGSADRPAPVAKYPGNIDVTGSWTEKVDVSSAFKTYNRIINNVTLALPHPGVVEAARYARNNIPIPSGTAQIDNFQVNASLPSPAIYVLCAGATAAEIKPLIWEEWSSKFEINLTNANSYQSYFPAATFNISEPFAAGYNETQLDKIFGWGPKYNHTGRRYPPLFPKLPKTFNSILNATSGGPWGIDAIYILLNINGVQSMASSPSDTDYALCSMKAGWVPYCSTSYSATGLGGTLATRCEDEEDKYRYNKKYPEAGPSWGQSKVNGDWRNIASEWANAISLGQGISDGNASNARMLSQLFPQNDVLDDKLPSLAEALAVLGTNTVLMSAKDTSFSSDWPYEQNMFMSDPKLENTTAAVRVQRYASRPTSPAQEAFIIILLFVFVTNFCILLWFLFFHRGLVTDYTEPLNLFSLSINSPASRDFAGACGGGPNRKQYRVRWFINADGEHVYLRSEDPGTPELQQKRYKFKRTNTQSPMNVHVDRLSKQRWSLL